MKETHTLVRLEPTEEEIRRVTRACRVMRLRNGFTLEDYALVVWRAVTDQPLVAEADASTEPCSTSP